MNIQSVIIKDLQVSASFHAPTECERRIHFLRDYLVQSRLDTLVLGISGGIDSTTAGRMCQLAVESARARGAPVLFVAMRLPYGVQADESDAQQALSFIQPDETLTIDIKPAADAIFSDLRTGGLRFKSPQQADFILGNIKARQRMVAQYAVAGARNGLVVGTDHAAEAVMGFFTKFGDGGFDLTPLGGLTKRRVRALATYLGAPEVLINKIPTADLESLRPQMPDETAYGVTYGQIDDYLDGKTVDSRAVDIIEAAYRATRHKRALPFQP